MTISHEMLVDFVDKFNSKKDYLQGWESAQCCPAQDCCNYRLTPEETDRKLALLLRALKRIGYPAELGNGGQILRGINGRLNSSDPSSIHRVSLQESWWLTLRLSINLLFLEAISPDRVPSVEEFERAFLLSPFRDRFDAPLLSTLAARARAVIIELSNADAVKPPSNVFYKQGDFWRVTFRGEELPALKDRRGFAYITQLLAGRKFETPLALEGAVQPATKTAHEQANWEQSEAEGLSSGSLPRQNIMDDKYIKNCKRRLIDIDKEIEDADQISDAERKEDLKGEKESITKELAAALGICGRPRAFSDADERARKAVSGAIHRALKKIKQHNDSLYRHLSIALTPVSFPYSYCPEQPTDWRT